MNQNPDNTQATRVRLLFIVPLIVFVGLATLLGIGLFLGDPKEIPSVLIGEPAPEFDLLPIEGSSQREGLAKSDLTSGEVVILNVWASWCGPCRYEHPLLMDIAKSGAVKIYGLNYKDEGAKAMNFLSELGDPYVKSGADITGRVGIDFGVYGVPETFIINGKGEIVYKHVGPIDKTSWMTKLKPVLEAAQQAEREGVAPTP
jgi:cytochrome c biogenesis protein CcmG, thiol:disulfide interchange protein DsbE